MCREKWALWPQFRKLPTQEWLFKGSMYGLPSEDDVRIGTDLSGWGCWVGSPRECPTLYMIWLWIDPGLPTLTRAWTPSQRRCDPTSSSSHRPRSPRPWWSPPLSLSETASLQLSRPFVILLPLVLILLLLTLWRSTLAHSPRVSTLIQKTIFTISTISSSLSYWSSSYSHSDDQHLHTRLKYPHLPKTQYIQTIPHPLLLVYTHSLTIDTPSPIKSAVLFCSPFLGTISGVVILKDKQARRLLVRYLMEV